VFLSVSDPASVPGIPLNIDAPSSTASDPGPKRGKQGIRNALNLVQHSTASMGRCAIQLLLFSAHDLTLLMVFLLSLVLRCVRYDESRYGEPEKKLKGKKRSFRDNIASTTLTSEKVLSPYNAFSLCLHMVY
jgi:hypothetical protein